MIMVEAAVAVAVDIQYQKKKKGFPSFSYVHDALGPPFNSETGLDW